MNPEPLLPAPGLAEIRIVAATPETARRVAVALRDCFDGDEQRSYPAGPHDTGTRLHLTVDTRVPAHFSGGPGPRPALGNLLPAAAPHSNEIRITTSDASGAAAFTG